MQNPGEVRPQDSFLRQALIAALIALVGGIVLGIVVWNNNWGGAAIATLGFSAYMAPRLWRGYQNTTTQAGQAAMELAVPVGAWLIGIFGTYGALALLDPDWMRLFGLGLLAATLVLAMSMFLMRGRGSA